MAAPAPSESAPEPVASAERVLHSRDLAREVRDPGACPARRSRASRTVEWLACRGAFAGLGVLGGGAWALAWAEPDLIFVPFVSLYLIFVFWIYTPTGYRVSESAVEVLQPQNPFVISRARIAASAGSRAVLRAWADHAGAPWLAELPHADAPPEPGARLIWLDPDVGMEEPGDAEPESGGRTQARAGALALPVWGVPLIHGGWAGRFWTPGRGVELRYARTLRPRVGFWLHASPER